jgi:lipid II:glycine glycyltransferase (peptidoglycan interpeptide bridge formation enzyme)
VTSNSRQATAADRAAWDAFVTSRPEADALQAWPWGEAHLGSAEEPIRYLIEDEQTRGIRAVAQILVRRSEAGRAVAYAPHGPVWDREALDADAVLDALIRAARTGAQQARAIVLKIDPRVTHDGPPDRSAGTHLAVGTTLQGPADSTVGAALQRHGFRRARHDLQAPTTRIVDLLDGGDALMASWHADARRLSKRAEREGVQVEIDRAGSADAIGEFHAILEATAERGDFRARSRTFLERAANAFAGSTGWYTVLARHGAHAIAGMALPRVGDRAYYLYGASLKEPELKHKYGAYAAMAAAMKALAADGVRTLDMWGVVEPDDPTADPAWEGFSAFKRTFGGRPVRHPGTFDLVLDPFWYRLRDLREAARAHLRR